MFRAFLALERLGLHVLPRHFYSPVADRAWLAAHPDHWRQPLPMIGVEWDLDEQMAWLCEVCGAWLNEVSGFSFLPEIADRGLTFRYGLVEAQILYCVVRSFAPRLIVEVGSGASTVVSAKALRANAASGRRAGSLVTIDPYSPEALDELEGVEVLRVPAQTVSTDVFSQLNAGDLLFLDATHVAKSGSEITRLYLEVLPSLRPGVLVHVHDVYLPYSYSPWILSDFWDWQETVLLAALLTNNSKLKVLCCESALHDAMPDRLRKVIPDYRPRKLETGLDTGGGGGHTPSSIWLKTG